MKKVLYLIVLSILSFNCGSDDETISENENINDSENESIDFDNIKGFSVSILTPNRERDYSYHSQGNTGVFENPNLPTAFKGKVTLDYMDNNSSVPSSKINIKWSSKKDGDIFEGDLNDLYESNFEKLLSKGNHKIYFEASIEDNSNFIAKDSITISNVISLQLENTDRSVKLKWSKYEGDDFQSYLIYRENFEPLVEIPNIDITEYEDSNITLANIKKFQIVVKTSNDEGIISGSNIEEEEAGKYIRIPHFVTKAINDKTRNRIYTIIGEEFSSNNDADEYGLLILDNNSQMVEIKSHILKEYRFSDLDMSLDGKYLFLCERGIDKITRLDLNNLEVTRFDIASFGWGIHKIEVGNNYRVYCHRRPPTSGNSPLFILDGINGEQKGFYNWLNHGDIEFNPINNRLYHSTSITSEKELIKFSVDNDFVSREKVFAPDIPFPKPFLLISENGEKLFWEKFQLDNNLNIEREFENPIIACNDDNSYISDGIKLMAFDDLSTVFEYPNFPSHEISKEVFINDDSILFVKSSQPYTNERFTHFFKIKI